MDKLSYRRHRFPSIVIQPENDLANRHLPMPPLITTLGGPTVADCSRCQSQRNYEFAMDRLAFGHRTPNG